MTSRRWIVREGDGTTVGEIVAKAAPGDGSAIADGRVFVGKRRAKDASEAVAAGDDVTVAQASKDEAATIRVLKRGKGWVAADKPAGIPTIADHGGASNALLPLTARAVGFEPARMHATSRLDREVSGVVVFATTTEAAERLKRAREGHAYARRYLALAARAPSVDAGTWDARIGRAKDPRHRAVEGSDATDARTHFAVVARAGEAALLALAPVTGRTHQLRVHASHAGAPLLGDGTYGGPTRMTLPSGKVLAMTRIALHAARVTIEGVTIESPVPAELRDLWRTLGGEDGAWELALAAALASR